MNGIFCVLSIDIPMKTSVLCILWRKGRGCGAVYPICSLDSTAQQSHATTIITSQASPAQYTMKAQLLLQRHTRSLGTWATTAPNTEELLDQGMTRSVNIFRPCM